MLRCCQVRGKFFGLKSIIKIMKNESVRAKIFKVAAKIFTTLPIVKHRSMDRFF